MSETGVGRTGCLLGAAKFFSFFYFFFLSFKSTLHVPIQICHRVQALPKLLAECEHCWDKTNHTRIAYKGRGLTVRCTRHCLIQSFFPLSSAHTISFDEAVRDGRGSDIATHVINHYTEDHAESYAVANHREPSSPARSSMKCVMKEKVKQKEAHWLLVIGTKSITNNPGHKKKVATRSIIYTYFQYV